MTTVRIECSCRACGYSAWTNRTNLNAAGPPICPAAGGAHGQMAEVGQQLEEMIAQLPLVTARFLLHGHYLVNAGSPDAAKRVHFMATQAISSPAGESGPKLIRHANKLLCRPHLRLGSHFQASEGVVDCDDCLVKAKRLTGVKTSSIFLKTT